MSALEEIELLGDANEAEWEAFVQSTPDATLYHRAAWRQVVERAFGYRTEFLMLRRNRRVVGILPLIYLHSRLFGTALISTAFGVGGGICARNSAAAERLAGEALRLGESLGVDYIELRGRQATLADWRTESQRYARFSRSIAAEDTANFAALPRKKRGEIRHAIKGGLRVEIGVAVEEFYALYARGLRDLGIPALGRRYLETLTEVFGDAVDISIVSDNERPLAGVLALRFKDEITPCYGGAVPAARGRHAYDLLYWSLLSRAAAAGARRFDFGRSELGSGAYAYKLHWGFQPEPLQYQYYLLGAATVPQLDPLNSKYRVPVALWRRLPLPLVNAVGPWVARQIG